MVEIKIRYEGNLHTTATHLPSGATLDTDAPKDNQGLGESFSPTDLVATALGTCMVTVMGICAKKHGFALEQIQMSVKKHMVKDPLRRIGKLEVDCHMPGSLSKEQRNLVEHAALTCPVRQSILETIEVPIDFLYQDNQTKKSHNSKA